MTQSIHELVVHNEETNAILVFVDLNLLLGKGVEIEVEGIHKEDVLFDVHTH